MSSPHSPIKQNGDRSMLARAQVFLKTFGAIPIEFKNSKYRFITPTIFWFYVVCTWILFIVNAVSTYKRIVERNLAGFFESLSYTTVVADCILKFTFYRGSFVKDICAKVELHEEEIRSNPEHNRYYNERLILSQKVSNCFLPASTIALLCLLTRPLYATVQESDGTVSSRKLITAYWYPIDPDKHHTAAYITEVVIMIATSQCIVFTDVFVCTLIYSCIGQFEIMHLRLKNIHQDSLKMAEEKMIPLNQAQVAVTRDIAIFHQQMIAMVKDIDGALRLYLLLQFLMSSFRVALTVFDTFWRDMSLTEQAGEYTYALSISLEVVIYYYISNDIMLYSSDGIYDAVSNSDYHELCPSSRRMLVIILCAAKTPLTLSIGPFDVVSLDTLLKIVKSGYYALSLLNHFQSKTTQ